MTGEDVHQVFEAILPQEAIDRFCRECGVIERQRKLHLGMLVRAMVIAAGTPGGAYQADILRSYLETVDKSTQKTIYLFNPKVSFEALLIAILKELGVEPVCTSAADMVSQLHELLIQEYRRGGTIVLIIDEAHSSQGGETATDLKEVLGGESLREEARKQAAEEGPGLRQPPPPSHWW
jgi:hypothetical protein